MTDRDPWQAFADLSAEEQERVYRSVRDRRMGSRAQTRAMSDAEIRDLADLLELIEQQRARRRLGNVLKTFLPR